ncbi:low molecular weight protein-tyrosine-phosphatase [Salinisphaera sp. Q1T1-3]|uniref:low molecular weight protein-tyrosine-phosphatase n=1 Tax=Salinisphaera sp. Q1T1-3 TaxID=2321229 RepID=UPI000E759EDB|nr:low molecular weight protein-tyrosine-phosphatase [Salinisphaera sp. Q1T1-3]RJS95371.1 low molecular weight phosphotyrosine protein phosphatase [Salinisphaera sp. Q1T1-3]
MTNAQTNRLSVLMVCLGNICRSPTAEGVLRDRLHRAGLAERVQLDSAGTGHWYVGKPPDRRAVAAAAERGYDLGDLRARQVSAADLDRFDYVIAMDDMNHADLMDLAGADAARRAKIHMLGDFSSAHVGEPVGDPYYGGDDGFDRVLDMVEACVDGLVETLQKRLD